MSGAPHNDYEGDEPVRGLPARLPPGERMLWQGAPDAWLLARSAFHVRQLAVYFAVLLAWYAVSVATTPGADMASALPVLRAAGLAVAAVGLLTGIAWLTARTTIYTITNKRLVMRFGIALPMTVNLPFALIDGAGVKTNRNGAGDVLLSLAASQKIAYALLWPHARPWKLRQPEPMLRALPDAAGVAQILARALAAASNTAVQAAPEMPAGIASRPHVTAIA